MDSFFFNLKILYFSEISIPFLNLPRCLSDVYTCLSQEPTMDFVPSLELYIQVSLC